MAGPHVGEVVCTCRMAHVRIVAIDDDGDTVVTEDDWRCSYRHCCDPPDHAWSHDAVHRIESTAQAELFGDPPDQW